MLRVCPEEDIPEEVRQARRRILQLRAWGWRPGPNNTYNTRWAWFTVQLATNLFHRLLTTPDAAGRCFTPHWIRMIVERVVQIDERPDELSSESEDDWMDTQLHGLE